MGWTLDRTADIPKSQRFTFGQRLDNLALDTLQATVKAISRLSEAGRMANGWRQQSRRRSADAHVREHPLTREKTADEGVRAPIAPP